MQKEKVLSELIKNKTHLGTTPVDPTMFQYLQGYRGKTPVINLKETLALLQKTFAFLKVVHFQKNPNSFGQFRAQIFHPGSIFSQ